MKVLSLNYQHRLNLYFFVGALQGRVADIRIFSNIMGAIKLSDEDKSSIKYKEDEGRITWDAEAAKASPLCDIAFEDEWVSRLKVAIENRPDWRPSDYDNWLKDVLDQIGLGG